MNESKTEWRRRMEARLQADLETLEARAQSGDETALSGIREILATVPAVWKGTGDLARQAEMSWVELACGGGVLARESVNRKLAALKADLAGEGATPLERLLVERVTLTWLQVHHADRAYTQALQAGVSLEKGDYLQRCIDRAQKRYLAAIKALAIVRRLELPPMQVNIAEQQLNQLNVKAAATSGRQVNP